MESPPSRGLRGSSETYTKLSNLLRTWMTVFGIGFFVFVVSQKEVLTILKAQPHEARVISLLVLAGLCAQIVIALAYKLTSGYEHHGTLYDHFRKSKRYRLSEWFNNLYAIEILVDISTVSCYVYATYALVRLAWGA